MGIFANPITSQVISILVAGFCGWLAAQMRAIKKRDGALYAGMRVLLRSQLFDAYDRYVVHEEKLSYERKEEVVEAFKAYSALGGNGVVSGMHDSIMQIPVETIH
ncbi:MAG: hypothetical protein J6J61_02320 [Muribaculaceae bacterium]|nr:hypothetical protein [Muribaculaceae bacterium]